MATPASYKPSPLGYGSPRSSPFRRPESPASPSPLRHTTPSTSPSKAGPGSMGTRLANGYAPTAATAPTATTEMRTPRGADEAARDVRSPSPRQHGARTTAQPSAGVGQGSALSQLQPSQVRTLREGFQILDRDSDGVVHREDVADMLHQLGLPSGPADVSPFFPPSAAPTMTLAAFINALATSLAALSPAAELLSAFSAFDDDDSGQVDLVELREALLHTAPEPGERALTAAEVDKVMSGFAGRRAFSKSKTGVLGKKGEVFKYHDFVHSIGGSNGGGGSRQGGTDEEDGD
ncbi:hypothetical protein VTK73DRAFT_630 [Phialemonium thermophilum]|uniref:EF-hand domain-containing protein n=1 Tax=Phialemonium thermophilum TaxID=223376 RepID=A0ABR3VUK9_9PEZI